MIAWTKFPFLRLNVGIVQVHIMLHRPHILMAQDFLKTKDVATQHEIADSKGMAEDMGTDTPISQPGPLAQALEQHLYTVEGKRLPGFCQEYMVISYHFRLVEFFRALAPAIQIIEQRPQRISTQCDTALFYGLSQTR